MKQQFFICPRCRTGLDRVSADRLVCPQDGLEYWNVEGIWRFLLPESQAHYTRFIEEYETVRRSEGRGSTDAEYYRALPYKDLSGNFSKDWAIRARSFDLLVKKLLTPIQATLERPLKVLDLGAGNGWLSNRLAAQEDRVVAVDLLVNELDGLGAWKHYEHQFTPIQAEFNHLPVMDGFADVAIFNASFHYSENYEETLKEAFRATAEDGVVVIMDTPVYHRRDSGEKMVAEREAAFQSQYGFPSNALDSENFLTYQRLIELGDALGIYWLTFRPFYGLRWLLRPLKAFLTRQREPAKFHLIAGYRTED
jgi:SAM-dependent methyltransferase